MKWLPILALLIAGLQAGDSERAAAPLPKPFMVGRIDVSHFAGLKPGDTEARVVLLYGPAVIYSGMDKMYGRGDLEVRYADNVVKRVQVYSKDLDGARSRAGNDALLDLFGQTESDAIAVLGPPTRRESYETGTYNLYWAFAMAGSPAGEYADLATGQTLAIGFRPAAGCSWVSVKW